MRRFALCLAVAGFAWGGSAQRNALAEAIYWVDSEGIQRSNLDGSQAEQVVSDVWMPQGIAVDSAGGKVYWTDELPVLTPFPAGLIMWANLDGSDTESLVELTASPVAIALRRDSENPAGGEMYWTNRFTDDVRRANLDGSHETVLVSGLEPPQGIAVDKAAGKVYWTDAYLGRDVERDGIHRANLDGSEVETVIDDLGGFATELALDPAAGKMYWGFVNPFIDGLFPGSIMRSNLDGSEVEEVISGLSDPRGIALDPVPGMIYWSDSGQLGPGEPSGTIQRASLDDWEVETLVTGLSSPAGIAIDPTPIPEPSVLVMMGAGGLVLAALTRCRGKRKPAANLRDRT